MLAPRRRIGYDRSIRRWAELRMSPTKAAPAFDPAAAAPARPTAVRRRVLALLLAYSFLSWFNRVSIAVAYDERIKDQLAIPEETMGVVYSALLLAYAVCMTPGGWLIDRYGAKAALVVMGLGSGLFQVLTGIVGFGPLSAGLLVAELLVVRALLGAFSAPIYPASSRVVSRWLPFPQRAAANGLVTAAALVGIASTYVGFGALIDWLDWPRAFVVAGAVTALVALAWTAYSTDRPEQHPGVNQAELQRIQGAAVIPEPKPGPGTPPGDWRELLRNRRLVLLTLSYAAVGYFQYLFFFWMHYYFDGVLHLGKDQSRLYATALNLAMAAGMASGGWLSDRLVQKLGPRRGRRLVPVGGMLGGATFLGLGLLATAPGWMAAWFALAMAAVGACEGPFWTTAVELGGRRGGTSAAICNTGGNAGGLLAPVLTHWVSKQFGWPWGLGLGGLVCLAGVGLWRWIDPAEGAGAKDA
jgi:MFS family permease